MEEIYLAAGIVIIVALSILPYIAIIGTWKEVKQVSKNLEETNQILEVLTKSVMEMKERQKIQGYSNNDNTQGEWLGAEQPRL